MYQFQSTPRPNSAYYHRIYWRPRNTTPRDPTHNYFTQLYDVWLISANDAGMTTKNKYRVVQKWRLLCLLLLINKVSGSARRKTRVARRPTLIFKCKMSFHENILQIDINLEKSVFITKYYSTPRTLSSGILGDILYLDFKNMSMYFFLLKYHSKSF